MKSLFIFALAVAAIPFNGLALAVLWAWFVAPPFHIPALGVAQAIGLSSTITFITSQYSGKDDRETSEQVVAVVLRPVIALGFGWIVKLFI